MSFCVYLLSDKKGLYYVGKTEDIKHRLKKHKYDIKNQGTCSSRYLDPDFDCQILEEYSNELDLAEGERKYYDIYREKLGDKLVNICQPLRTKAEWQNFSVYLLSDKKGLYYIGKTIDIRQRITVHKSNIRYQGTCSSRYLDLDFNCEILEEYSNEPDLAEGERKYYDIYREKYGDKLLNMCQPLRTKAEWHAENAEEIKAKKKQHYAENAEEIKAKTKQYRAENAEEIKAQKKQYYAKNAEEYKAQKRQYYAENADKIKAKANQKHTCELCGGRYTRSSKSNHFKSQKHSGSTLRSSSC